MLEDPGVNYVGAVRVRNNDALGREDQERRSARAPVPRLVDRLSGHIETSWSQAKRAKEPIEQQMLRNLRQRHGVYEPEKMANIRAMGGAEVYMLLTSTKCRAAEAWIEDILRPVSDRPWQIEPTPIADLPPDAKEQIVRETMEVREEVMRQAAAVNQQIPSALLMMNMRQYAWDMRDKIMDELQAEAKKRSERMAEKIADQLVEGGWHEAFWAVIQDLVTLKAGVLKGPVLRMKKRRCWVRDENGRTQLDMQPELVPCFERVSPFDIYPAPGARSPDDDFLIQRHQFTRQDLVGFLGVPGFSDDKIRVILEDYGESGTRERLTPDPVRNLFELGESDTTNWKSLEGHLFWGSVPGEYLIDWGMDDPNIDPRMEYEIDAWKIGEHVFRAVLNPDKLGRKPFSVVGYENVAGSFWKKGVPELMGDLQDMCNAVARALSNNSMLASGPQVEVDVERVTDGTTQLFPWYVWESTNRQMSDQPAVRFTQPQIIIDPLLKAFEFFMTMAEDQTGVPRWSHGNANLGGAGATSSGLSMLMTAATRGMKQVISHIDVAVEDGIERLYDYNMLYDEDESIKGDCRIVARGTKALVEKEQQSLRRTEYLASTANPIDVQLVGLKNRSKMLMQQARDLGLDVEEPEELPMLLNQLMQQLAAQPMGGAQPANAPMQPKGGRPPPENPRALGNDGAPAGGTDHATQMNRPGVRPGAA